MALDSDDLVAIARSIVLKQPNPFTGEEAEAAEKQLRKDIDEVNKLGYEVDLPQEWPNPLGEVVVDPREGVE